MSTQLKQTTGEHGDKNFDLPDDHVSNVRPSSTILGALRNGLNSSGWIESSCRWEPETPGMPWGPPKSRRQHSGEFDIAPVSLYSDWPMTGCASRALKRLWGCAHFFLRGRSLPFSCHLQYGRITLGQLHTLAGWRQTASQLPREYLGMNDSHFVLTAGSEQAWRRSSMKACILSLFTKTVQKSSEPIPDRAGLTGNVTNEQITSPKLKGFQSLRSATAA